MRISELDGRRVAIWGWGREARAAHAAVRSRLPTLALTAICSESEAAEVLALNDALVQPSTQADADALASFDVVIKSPGISPYRSEVEQALASGTRFVGGTELWFAEYSVGSRQEARTICVTGTKGKSTTTALIAHMLRAGGHRTALAGNIGMPLLELLDPSSPPEFWVIELSSYQTRDVAASGVRPDVAVGLNVYPEHLDWHGSEARYVADKLALFSDAHPHTIVLNKLDRTLAALELPDWQVQWFNAPHGWHVSHGQLLKGDDYIIDTRAIPLPGRHNLWNVCAALAAIDALGIDASALAAHAMTFMPLPHRLQPLGMRDGVGYVNDSISTTPHASMAALDCYADNDVAILVGGFDRGVDWSPFVERMHERPAHAVITMGQNGPRIRDALQDLANEGILQLHAAQDMAEAVAIARAALTQGGTILLSPGAPSFGAYVDYAARGRDFAAMAGFDPDAISRIPGLGIA
ncbi:MAG: UDP-N-acetylmuramoyl-L-alanine--D-glutamate ligase [Lysobacteraceae bacterium]